MSFEAITDEAVFCEGNAITFRNNSVTGWDFFIIDWQDGQIDTIYDYSEVSHGYSFPEPEEGECNDPESFDVEFRGITNCGDEGQSCHRGTLSFSVRPNPIARMMVPSLVCSGRPLQFSSESCNGGEFFWEFGDGTTSDEQNPMHTYAEPGDYIVRLTVTGRSSCSDISDVQARQVTIVRPPNSIFELSDDDLIACRGTEITLVNRSNDDTNIRWNITPGSAGGNNWMFADTTMNEFSDSLVIIFDRPNSYRIELVGTNACETVRSDETLVIEEAPDVNIRDRLAGCDAVVVTPASLGFTASGSISSVCWSFVGNPAADTCEEDFGELTFANSGTVRLAVESLCGVIERTVAIDVQPSEVPTLTADEEYCTGNSPDTLRASAAGGRWSGPGITDAANGVFAPAVAEAGTHTLTYRVIQGECTNENTVEVRVVASETVTTEPADFCADGFATDLVATPTGGVWSGTGITDTTAGTFDPATAGVGPADVTYTYVDMNGCEVRSSPAVEVFVVPVVTGADSVLVCLTDQAIDLEELTGIAASVPGGTYNWDLFGTPLPDGTVNPVTDLGAVGVYPLGFRYENGPCNTGGLILIRVIENPQLELIPQDNVCITDGTLQLEATLPGGRWSGPGVDPVTGVVNLAMAGGGSRTYEYVFQPNGSCEQRGQQTITIEDPGATIEAGDPVRACEAVDLATVLNGASPVGGRWSGPGLTDSLTGAVDLTQLLPGQTYEYVYSIESATTPGCAAADTKELIYNPEPDPNYTISGSPCVGESFALTANQEGAGYTYRWGFGDGTTDDARSTTHVYSSGGQTFTQTLVVTSPQGCPADTSASIYVTTPPVPSFTLDSLEGCAPFVLDLADESSGDQFTSTWFVNGDTLPGGQNLRYVIDSFYVDTLIEIRLVAENFCGARPQVQSVLVKPYPLTLFGLAEDDGCSPFTPELSNVSRGNVDSWAWDMGNGVTGTDSIAPSTVYVTPDDSVSTFEVTLVATNECGADTLTEPVTVFPPDVRAFIGLDTVAGCQPWAFRPQSFSTPAAALAWEVTGPNGNEVASGNGAAPEFLLTEVGLHRVILRAARCGEDADTVFVDVLPAPEVSFAADPTVCRGDELLLTNTSTGLAGGFYDLGDGRTTDQVTTAVTYDSVADYTISFTGFSALNNCPATVSRPVTVRALPEVAIAASDTSGCGPLRTTLTNVAPVNGTLTYDWAFDDGTNNSDEAGPTHEYLNPGTYSPTLTVTDAFGCQRDTVFPRITVHPDPEPGFTFANPRFCVGYDSLRLVDASRGATMLDWTIDGEDYGGTPPVLPLTEAGEFSVELLATNAFGCSATAQQTYRGLPSPEVDAVASPSTLCLNETLTLDANARNATVLTWELGDGTGSTEATVRHRFATAGTYPVSLLAENNNGCPAATATVAITVHPLPTSGFTLSETVQCGTPAEVVFNNTSTGALAYEWRFGDGATATSLNATHTYTEFGEYAPSLMVVTEFGCRDTSSQPLSISGDPMADFGFPPALACAPYGLRLEATPTEAVRYEWYLDDAFAPRVGTTFDTVLTELRSYDLRLIAIYDDLCRDTLDVADIFRLEAGPTADFSFVADGDPNRLGDVEFTSLSTGGDEYFWDLGDGNFQDVRNFLHEYRVNPDVTVTHAVTQRYPQGLVCSDTIRREVSPEFITTFFVPNAVSPESGPDEVRTWGAKGFGVAAYRLEVFSNFGQLLFSTDALEDSQPSGRWDVLNPETGELVLQGAYSWRAAVEFVDGRTENYLGTVTVLR